MTAYYEPFGKMSVFDLVRAAALFVAVLVSLSSQRNWIRLVTIAVFFHSLIGLLFPTFMLNKQLASEAQPIHLMLFRLADSFLFLITLIEARIWSKSRDDTVISSMLWARSIRIALLSLNACYYFMRFQNVNMCLFLFTILLFTVGSLYQLLMHRNPINGSMSNTPINWLLLSDFILTLTVGVMYFAMPDWIVDIASLPPGGISYYIIRYAGSIIIANAYMSYRATTFRQFDDYYQVFLLRLLSKIVFVVLIAVFHHSMPVLTLNKQLALLGLFSIHAFPAAAGIILTHRQKTPEPQHIHYTRSKGRVD